MVTRVDGGAIARSDGGRILLNTGPTERGWHRLETALRCLQLYAYLYILKLKLPPGDALIRGSIAHTGLAHYYARLRAQQRGENPDVYYPPAEAMRLAAELADREFQVSTGAELLRTYAEMPAAYEEYYRADQLEILHVEEVFEARVNGHRFTQRIDLVVRDRNGRVFFYDHKTASRVDKRTVARYSLSGQFLALQSFGHALYGEKFGGVRINFISGERPPFKFERRSLEPAPHMLSNFPRIVDYAERRIARAHELDPWCCEPAASDLVCVHSYGRCAAYEMCQWGPSGVSAPPSSNRPLELDF